ncbi:hypothetical protein HS088_TW10G00249 [Tripterygium wilfordii]|uniref:Uncharacterized protein n=1 Tax=Tripterygium wilfordii TaxID=458696 RepID=A0A7J7D4K6_TRIWF|nr:hypothetical protein HS088_TW10G00249 [Tripterygium wilfordii]
MDRYQRVEKPKPESPISENEIRITSQGLIRNYISYATTLIMEKRGKRDCFEGNGPSNQQDSGHYRDIEVLLLDNFDILCMSEKLVNRYQAPSVVEQPKRQYHYQQQQQPRPARTPYNAANEGVIHMAEAGVVVEGEGGIGAGVDMETIMEIMKETIKIMAGIQIGAEVVAEEEVGAIAVLDMKEAEEGTEAMSVVVEGWVVSHGEVVTKHIRELATSVLRSAKCLPWPLGEFYQYAFLSRDVVYDCIALLSSGFMLFLLKK